MLAIRKFKTSDEQFTDQFQRLLAWETVSDKQVNHIVDDIIHQVRTDGDIALLSLTAKLDRFQANDMTELCLPMQRLEQAFNGLPDEQRMSLQYAAQRIEAYHQRQVMESWRYTEADGTQLGQKVTPLDSVGLYVPGGKAAYPSSVLMNGIPAKVAGVEKLVMVVPCPDGEMNELVLAAAHVVGVDAVFAIGGAQAVAALAYGTESVPKVDKIVGPGNIFVATAKRAVFGQVGIDMIAGPSEICVVADESANPKWVAMDLFSQAEHDEDAQSILVTTSEDFADKVISAASELIQDQPRAGIIAKAMNDRGFVVVAKDMDEALDLVNQIAPEHLELSVANPEALLDNIRHAGAIFMGHYTAEPLGDYCAGPNHVLPTSGTARFSSPLGVYDFQKRSSIIYASATGAKTMGRHAMVLANGEGLFAHQQSAAYRVDHNKD